VVSGLLSPDVHWFLELYFLVEAERGITMSEEVREDLPVVSVLLEPVDIPLGDGVLEFSAGLFLLLFISAVHGPVPSISLPGVIICCADFTLAILPPLV
jgi:hypothetical protein